MADAARRIFRANGEGIVWAVLDSGIDQAHPHFRQHRNLELEPPLDHQDFIVLKGSGEPLVDRFGHGTHVAGIIAGEVSEETGPVWGQVRGRTDWGTASTERQRIQTIAGMAPQTKLLSLKVIDDNGKGLASSAIAALQYIQEVNGYGRLIRIHGVNISLFFDYDAQWFACGQSPLCVEVDRLVKTGVVVVAAAGNTGFGWQQTVTRGTVAQAFPLSINDPGNAELAITVGSTHRDMPQVYGVSYFSSRGPTADGRSKPDVVAPGEMIMSCQSTQTQAKVEGDQPVLYREDSGTAMAAAHVSGLVSAFLSVRREEIGQALRVKEIFRQTTTDLNRHVDFQGRGLVNLMRALQPTVDVTTNIPQLVPSPSRSMTIDEERRTIDAAGVSRSQYSPDSISRARRPTVSLFCSYAQEDERLRNEFERSVVHLLQERLIEIWYDGEIMPGMEWRAEIDRELAVAHLIILLVSPDFMRSDFIHRVELKQAIERHDKGKVRVIAIVLRPVTTLGVLAKLEVLPLKAKPLTTWRNRDSAWANVAQGVERVVRDLLGLEPVDSDQA